jgi:hypothetical protein
MKQVRRMVIEFEVEAESDEDAISVTRERLEKGMPSVARYLPIYVKRTYPSVDLRLPQKS